jgi:dephospho-CoA kinase
MSAHANTYRKFIVGLTGGIGSGKSEVARRFKSLGIDVFDADEVARVVVREGEPALAQIAEHFGADILLPTGALNRARLREIIFAEPDAKRWLEALLHPLINREVRQRLAEADSPYSILMSPLLLETEQHQLVDRILVVDTSEAEQQARASLRDNIRAGQIQAIMATQLGRQERLARAQDIIDNHGDLSALNEQVAALHQQYLALSND